VAKPDQSAFLASVVHELRAPLNASLMSVNLLELKATEPEAVLNSARVIRRNLERQAALIRDLSDVLQIASDAIELQHERTAISLLVDGALRCVAAAAAEHGVELEPESIPAGLTVETDSERAVQVLATLLEHLLASAAGGGSRIRLEAHAEAGGALLAATVVRDAETSGEASEQPGADEKAFAVRLLVADYLLERLGGSVERSARGFTLRLPAASGVPAR
jgi:signal transduction histidine kinase